jgi:tetratricopeptide (TPR) repeat protein
MQVPENNGIVVRTSPDEEAALRHGNGMVVQGRFEEAARYSSRAIEIRPDSAMAWHSRATAPEAPGNFDRTLAWYDAAPDCDAGDAGCRSSKGVTLKKPGRYNDGSASTGTGVHIATVKKIVSGCVLPDSENHRLSRRILRTAG